ncbi:DUF3078 domain-containing protein [Lutibacter maritimus]|uniref:DUF3078 domain-containing protein n=1 Tax=Lutibacter maritimus TaxID=593133 RepID=A0A1I6PH00_9FLAO|nr:DUF3078 domain-containing protein [Lutibacter maritimus]SFS39443.1 Protein of unknown function [Lutibacter maritimus]
MKFKLLTLIVLLTTISINATILNDSLALKKDSISHWTKANKVRLIFTQNSFVNWSAGGNNSIAGIVKINISKNYKNNHTTWFNELKTNYGLNKEEKRELRKTEDLLEVNSTFGYRQNTNSNWYYSAKFNFKTQYTNGYKYPNTDKPISKFFAPAYLFLGVGTEYAVKESNFKLYLSPVTNKTTFVFNQRLADEGAFGVKKASYDTDGNLISEGEKTKIEFGMLATGEWKSEVMKNIQMANKLILYSDYLNNYGNIDIDWEINFDLTINKYVTANVGSHFLFDDDVKHKEDVNNDGTLDILGPKIQIKQVLGVGFIYNF